MTDKYIFKKRINYGLCSSTFDVKPYCNQMGGMLDETYRFCNVCNKFWKILDNRYIMILREKYEEDEIEVSSKWFDKTEIVQVVEIKDGMVLYACEDTGKLGRVPSKWFLEQCSLIVKYLEPDLNLPPKNP